MFLISIYHPFGSKLSKPNKEYAAAPMKIIIVHPCISGCGNIPQFYAGSCSFNFLALFIITTGIINITTLANEPAINSTSTKPTNPLYAIINGVIVTILTEIKRYFFPIMMFPINKTS